MTLHDADDDARRSRLNGLKLRALVRDHLGDDEIGDAEEFAPGAALVHDDVAWVFLDDRPATRLGAALVWATRRNARRVQVIAEEGTGVLARRAALFDVDVDVWHAEGRSLLPAVAEPYPVEPLLPERHEAFRERIVEGGADPVVEHGVLVGEVRGLEVCRVVDDPHLDTTRLEVGVGAHDREAFQMLHGDVPTADSLARVVEAVAEHRRADAPQHPLNRLGAERLIRWRVIDEPDLVGLASATPASPPVPRANLKDPVPCVALGATVDGDARVVVCSSGIDLDLVPFAADARASVAMRAGSDGGREPDLLIVVPSRDLVRVTEQLNAALVRPATFATVD